MSETIEARKVVTLSYVLSDSEGKELERRDDDTPLHYLHGAFNIVDGLEEALAGKSEGDEFEVEVPPEKGYGTERRKPIRIPRSSFDKDMELKPGTGFHMGGPQGQPVPLWIKKVQGPTVVCSPDHPYTAKTLHFTGKVLGVRDASEEELAHGHVHGPGGHHHDGDDADG